eukprot:TRINITY_DN17804_c0_g1_i1.p1 TRINITY_DN17804_c0_g1~~TRINITY_DN17804_c0_g1_i1.p1  ORF type:complete len:147 (+),score=49.95 TRINITY_DN17804_c0_g1_i1:50-442(+)
MDLDANTLKNEDDPLKVIREMSNKLEKQYMEDREMYKQEKRGEELTKEEKEKVLRYRETRKKLRAAEKKGSGMSLMAKMDLFVYFLFAVGIYFVLLWEYKIDMLPIALNWLKPNFDHHDENGNWRTQDEL